MPRLRTESFDLDLGVLGSSVEMDVSSAYSFRGSARLTGGADWNSGVLTFYKSYDLGSSWEPFSPALTLSDSGSTDETEIVTATRVRAEVTTAGSGRDLRVTLLASDAVPENRLFVAQEELDLALVGTEARLEVRDAASFRADARLTLGADWNSGVVTFEQSFDGGSTWEAIGSGVTLADSGATSSDEDVTLATDVRARVSTAGSGRKIMVTLLASEAEVETSSGGGGSTALGDITVSGTEANAGVRVNTANNALVFSKWANAFPIFAEESGNVSSGTNGGFQFSFGNGDVADGFGIVIPFDFEIVAVGMSVRTSSAATSTVEVYKGADADSTASSTGATVSLSSGERHNINDISGSPVSGDAGDWITFRTTASSGTANGGRPVAWIRPRS